jgi:HK97 family phage major capsid protein
MWVELVKDFLGQKAGARIELDEVNAKALVSSGTAKEIVENPLDQVIQKSIGDMMTKVSGAIESAATAAVKQFASTQTLSRKNQIPAIFGSGEKGDPKKTFGAFLVAVARGDQKALEEMGSHYCEWEHRIERKTDMGTNVGARGGFAVPTQHYDDIALVVMDKSIVRKRARIIEMTGRQIEIPTPNYTTAPSAGDTASLSGLVLRWAEEGASVNQSEPTLKQLEIINYELSGYSKINNSLMEDAPGLESFLKQLFAEGIAWYEDYAFLRGDGVKKPLGMVTWCNNNSFTQTRSAASTVALADVATLYGKLLRGMATDENIFWAVHNTVLQKLLTMTGGDSVIFLGNDINGKPKWQILGHDVEITEKLPALNTAGDILLANGSHYIIGDRKQYEIAFSEHAGFTTNQTFFRVVSRVGGMPWIRDKVTLSDASSTLGSFVTLTAG